MTPLLMGDVFHLSVTLWSLGDARWVFAEWSPMLWTTVLLGLTLMVPRILWHLGVGRYVDKRDAPYPKLSTINPSSNTVQSGTSQLSDKSDERTS